MQFLSCIILIGGCVFLWYRHFYAVEYEPQIYEYSPIYEYEPVYLVITEPLPEYEMQYEPETIFLPILKTIYLNGIRPMYNAAMGERVGHISSSYVNVYEIYENWAKISTHLGMLWVDTETEIPVWEITQFLAEFPNLAIFYENLETGFTFEQNANRVFFGASATKANFALYIWHKISIGESDLYSEHAFTSGDFWEGSGVIRHAHQVGDMFTQRRLLHLMISPSDNIATRILRRVHGLDGYREFIYSIGGRPELIHNLTYSHFTAHEAALIMRTTYNFYRTGCEFFAMFIDDLINNRYPFIVSDHPVASKSGWSDAVPGMTSGAGYHDMAIVFADSPYILAILSDRAGTDFDMRNNRRISMFFQEFNDTWFTLEASVQIPQGRVRIP